MISCIEWIPKGVADPNPKRYELSKAERDLLDEEVDTVEDNNIEVDVEEDEEEIADATNKATTAASIIAANKIDPSSLPPELRMDEYSDDEDESNVRSRDIGQLLIGNDSTGLGIDENGNVEDIYEDMESEDDDDDNLEDVPDTREFMESDVKGLEAMNFGGYTGTGDYEDGDEDDDSDIDDTNLRPDDALVIIAKTEEDFASLEVLCYEESTGNVFVHHDIPLPAYPLCLAHGTINNEGGTGNYVAVGTFEPGIEIWNADILNPLEPTVVLGGEDTTEMDAKWAKSLGGKKKERPNMNSRSNLKVGSHTEAVMSLSWNSVHRQVIASGSADHTVKLWDVTKSDDATNGNAATLTHHSNKVQSVRWHPSEGTILATGGYDRIVAIVDARSPNSSKQVKIPADCESIAWDPHHPHLLSAASEDGTVTCWDVRNFETSKPYWQMVAHEFGGCSDISYNSHIPGMFASCAIDKTVAVWDTLNIIDGKPFSCGNKDMNVGKLYSLGFYPSSPWLLGCAGSGNLLALWDMSSENAFKSRFGERLGEKHLEGHENRENAEQDFEAIMAAQAEATKTLQHTKDSKKKQKGKGKKKKVHKR
jgi:periodic tryptophan protein 1